MQVILPVELLISLIVAFGLIIIWLFRKVSLLQKNQKNIEVSIQANELASGDMQVTQSVLEKKIDVLTNELQQKSNEDIQISKQIEHRVKLLKQEIEKINSIIELLKEQQPQDKFYTRATKLAALGADAEEIMAECELPRAEVEMLLAVYQQKKSTS